MRPRRFLVTKVRKIDQLEIKFPEGGAEELCGTIQYLISDASNFVTGTVAVVDGGFNAFAM